jgi:hypothetical protein
MRDIEQEFIEERTNAIEARARDLRAYAAATVADADEPPTVRQRWIAREAAGSRHRATAAATTDDDADADGDDSATTGDTRADYLARQSALSRKPATGSGGWR